jgi:hypothetical protein
MLCLLAGCLQGVVVGYSGMDKSLSGVGVLGCLATLCMPLLSLFGFVARPGWFGLLVFLLASAFC